MKAYYLRASLASNFLVQGLEYGSRYNVPAVQNRCQPPRIFRICLSAQSWGQSCTLPTHMIEICGLNDKTQTVNTCRIACVASLETLRFALTQHEFHVASARESTAAPFVALLPISAQCHCSICALAASNP